MPFGLSKKISALRESIEDRLAGREAGKFGDVKNPSWASATHSFCHFTDSPKMKKKKSLLFLPSAEFGPLRLVLHKNVLSGVAGPTHRIVALNRNGRIMSELVFTCAKDVTSIDALNSARKHTGLGRSLVLLLGTQIPSNKAITVHATHGSAPFYKSMNFHELGGMPDGSMLLTCKRDELFRNNDGIARTGARKGKVFVR